jgi:pterin-4a-carbinolamine dehydratase/uncharacterized protein (DUF2267 family)
MMTYTALIDGVKRRTGLSDVDEARHATAAVLTALGERLDDGERAEFAAALPGLLGQRVVADAEPDAFPGVSPEPVQLSAEVARRTRSTPERGREIAEQVLAELTAEDPDLAEQLRPRLPDGLAALLVPAPVPDAVLAGHPRRILPDELDRRLRELEDWSGDCHRITRTVLLPEEWIEPLRRRVDRAEQELDHHVRLEPVEGGVRFEAWTKSIDAVTEMDFALAARVDEAVAEAG